MFFGDINIRDTSKSRFFKAVTKRSARVILAWIERKMIIFPDGHFPRRCATYLVIQKKRKRYVHIYVNSFRWISHYTPDARTRMVKQSVHLLPRSVIYFEDFLSSRISRHTFLYALCVGCDWNIFLMRGTKRATWNILVYGDASISKTLHLRGGGRGASGADTREEIKDLSSVNGLLFDSIRSEIFVSPIRSVACVSYCYLHSRIAINKIKASLDIKQ